MNKKIRLVLPAIIIILLISILSAIACTYLMEKIKYQEFSDTVTRIFRNIDGNLSLNFSPKGGEREQKSYKYEMEQIVANQGSDMDTKDELFDYAVLLYDLSTGKTVISDPRIVVNEDLTIHLSDYLSKEEIISYATDFRRSIYSKGGMFKVYLNSEGIPTTIETTGLPPFTQIKLLEGGTAKKWDEYMSYFPKRSVEKEVWIERFTSWMNNETLQREIQNAKDRIKNVEFNNYLSDSLIITESQLYDKFFENGSRKVEPYCNIIIIATYHPWLAAIRDLKPVYIMISLISLVCIFFVSRNTLDTFNKQKNLEETKSSFIAAMAHDLKTPLTVIRGYSENMLDNGGVKNEEYLHNIINKTDEINDKVSKMLQISKVDSAGFEVERKEIILNDILSETVKRYLPAIEQRFLSYSIDDSGKFELIGDEIMLDQMLSNMIDNAVSYAEENSEIKIKINQNILSVWNKSDPLPDETKKHLYELSPGKDGNHGFGLYYVKRIAEIHDLKLEYSYFSDGIMFAISR